MLWGSEEEVRSKGKPEWSRFLFIWLRQVLAPEDDRLPLPLVAAVSAPANPNPNSNPNPYPNPNPNT